MSGESRDGHAGIPAASGADTPEIWSFGLAPPSPNERRREYSERVLAVELKQETQEKAIAEMRADARAARNYAITTLVAFLSFVLWQVITHPHGFP